MTPLRHDLGLPAHHVAWVTWASMLAVPVLFLGVVVSLGGPGGAVGPGPSGVLVAAAVASSALGILLSLVLPPRVSVAQGAGRPHVTALTRLVLRWSLCEGVAMFPLVAFLLRRDARLLAVFAVDLLVLLASFPSRARWEAALPPDAPRPTMVH